MRRKLIEMLKGTALYPMLHNYRQARTFRKVSERDTKRAAFYRQFIEPGDLVFDVGANLGNRTKAFLALQAKVVAFEPQKLCADFLQNVLSGEPDFRLVRKALGANPGSAEMLISDAHTISTLSSDWVRATQASGRFSEYRWEQKQSVEITTLDHSIAEFGKPTFVKIDVEGYEFEVLSGLSTPIQCISIEFAPEYIDNSLRCIAHMDSLASDVTYQFSLGESMEFMLPEWVPSNVVQETLRNLDPKAFGDIYIRCR